MDEPVLLSGFSNSYLTDFYYHSNPDDFEESYIKITATDSNKNKRVLLFKQPSNLVIEKDFNICLSGMVIVDISSRQWGHSRIEVQNFEQDPGITFLAKSMEIVADEFYT